MNIYIKNLYVEEFLGNLTLEVVRFGVVGLSDFFIAEHLGWKEKRSNNIDERNGHRKGILVGVEWYKKSEGWLIGGEKGSTWGKREWENGPISS